MWHFSVLFSLLFLTSCGMLMSHEKDHYGGSKRKETGIYCQYPDGPLPQYTVIDSKMECQEFDENKEMKGRVKNIKIDDCSHYLASEVNATMKHYGQRDSYWELMQHPCFLKFDSTRVEFESVDATSYKAKKLQSDGGVVEEVNLVCRPFSIEGSSENTDCDSIYGSGYGSAWERAPSVVCNISHEAGRYCFEFFGVSVDAVKQAGISDQCNLSPAPRSDVCSSGGYRNNFCEYSIGNGKSVIGWHEEELAVSDEEKKKFCERLSAIGAIDKFEP